MADTSTAQPVSLINWPTTRGLLDDVNNLITQTLEIFDDTQTLRIKHFHTVWKRMKFGLIFHGRQSYRELYEFTEDLLSLARNFSLHPQAFGTRAASFYLLYTLYMKQPCRPRVRIRVDYEQYEDLCHWIEELRAFCHWELVYCWAKLVSENAFVFTGTTKPVGLENVGKNQDRFGNNVDGKTNKKRNFEFPNEAAFNKDSFSDILERLTKTHNQYVSMKNALIGDQNLYDASLDQASTYFPGAIKEIVDNPKSLERGISGNLLKEGGVTIGQRRKQIIESSFGIHDDVEEDNSNADVPEIIDGDKKQKGKGKNRFGNKKLRDKINVDHSQDLKTLARSLAAVREDPSLLIGIDDDDIVLPKKKKILGAKRGRPKKSSNAEVGQEDDDFDNEWPLKKTKKGKSKTGKRSKKEKKSVEKQPKPQPSIFDI